MKKSGFKHGLFAFLVVLIFVSMGGVVNADVIINEIMYAPNTTLQGTDTNLEWVELFNNGTVTVNLESWELEENSFGDVNISPGGYVVVARQLIDNDGDFSSFEAYYGNNNGVWNLTDANYEAVDGGMVLTNTGTIINLSNGSTTQFTVDYTQFATLNLGKSNGKTLIFYKGNFTESAFVNGTPGANNDQFAPDFNKWVNPSTNNSFIKGLFNITVNVTDVTNVSSALINFSNNNFSMSKNNDLWYYLWNTTKNSDGQYNITIFFNDTLGFSNTDTLFNATVDNTAPKIDGPNSTANTRSFVNPGFLFNASVNATDVNILNVTCAIGSTTSGNFTSSGKTHTCNLTAPASEGDFDIIFTAIDRAGNKNTTNLSFTTKYTTSAKLVIGDITVSDLNQSSKTIEVNATLNNTGNNPIYDAGIILDSFSSASLSPIGYQSCGANINSSQSCNVTFNVTVAGGSTGTHNIFWNANWTDNNFTKRQFESVKTSSVTISNNPQVTAASNVSASIPHGTNATLRVHINSTGNFKLDNVNARFVEGALKSSFLNVTSITFSSIDAGTSESIDINVAMPKHINPNNYTGLLNITANGISPKIVKLIVEVPLDNSWTSLPNNTATYAKSSVAGLAGIFKINNTGNIGHNYSLAKSGNFVTYNLWNDSNPDSIYVESGEVKAVAIYHLAMEGSTPSTIGSFNLTLTIASANTSQSNKTFISLVRDDNNPNVNATSPANNSFVNGDVIFRVNASDLNLSRIEFFINNSLVLKDTNFTKNFNWTSANGSYPDDVYTLKAIAYDSAGNFNTSDINVTVNNMNDNPILKTIIPNITLNEEATTVLNLSNHFKSIDGDSLNYTSTTPDNITIFINNTNTTATFIPKGNFSGIRYVVFFANDSSADVTASNNITINVANVNDAPTTPALTSPLSGSNVTSSAGKATLTWSASADADNDAITYYVFVSNDSSNIKFNTTTTAATLQLTSVNNKNTYYWKVLASDGSLNSSNSSIFNFMSVRDSDPVINKWTWNNTISISSTNTSPIVAENRTLNFTINASDPDNNPVNFTWLVNSSEKSSAQNFSFNLINNFTAAGNYAIKLQVQDNNSNSVTQEWQVTVTNTNREPVLDDISDKSATEDSALSFNITVSDADNDSLSFSANISGVTFTKAANNSLAAVSWTPTNDNVGDNTMKIVANDSSKTDSKTIKITVTNTNDPPIITDFFPTENKTIAAIVGSQKFNITFTDIDPGDTRTAGWYKNGTQIFAMNPEGGTLTNLTAGLYNITVITQDSVGFGARYEWKLTVTTDISSENLTSPVLSLNETQRQNVTNVTINQSAFGGIDFGNNSLNLSGIVKLEDAFNISKGFVSVDTNTYAGLKNKSASVVMKGLNFTKAPLLYRADGFESTSGAVLCPLDVCTNITYDTANKVLRFRAANFSTYFTQTNTTNGAPIITSAAVKTATENAKYTYSVKATDPDGDVLTFSLTTKPSGMSISSSTGVISWTPTTAQLGLNNVAVNVSDGNLWAEQSFNITVGKGPRLIISDLDVKVDTKTDKGIQNNTKISKEAAPGSKVEFKLEAENLFTDAEDLEIEDIDVEITIEDIDDGDDLDEDTDEFDLKAGKNEDVSIEFDIPLEVDEDIYDVIIAVEGEDENQTTHEILWNLELEVEKEAHEIRILKSDINPLTISCQRQVALNAEIINTGTEDEDEVTLEITSPELGISSVTAGLELDEGTDNNRFTKQLTVLIGKDISAGVYPVTFSAYYDSSLSEAKTVELTVEECELTKAVKEKVKEKKPVVEVIRPKATTEKPEAKQLEPSFRQTSGYKTLLAIMVILFIGTAVFVVGGAYMLLRK